MASISQTVKHVVRGKPLLFEGLSHDVLNYANVAETIQKEVEQLLGKKTTLPAIIMALRRYQEELKPIEAKKSVNFNHEIIMKSGLCDITVLRTPSMMTLLKNLYSMVDLNKGDTLNILQGNYEISIVMSQKHLKKIKAILKREKIINIETNLTSLTMSVSKDFLYSPGVLAQVTQTLYWEGINVYENISTMTELIYIVHNDHAVKAFSALQRLVEK